MLAFITSLDSPNALIDLVQNTLAGQPSAGAETAVITEYTATEGDRAIHVGASESRVNTDPLNTVSKLPFQMVTVGIVTISVLSPVKE